MSDSASWLDEDAHTSEWDMCLSCGKFMFLDPDGVCVPCGARQTAAAEREVQ